MLLRLEARDSERRLAERAEDAVSLSITDSLEAGDAGGRSGDLTSKDSSSRSECGVADGTSVL